MSDDVRDDPWLRKIAADEARLGPTYDLNAFVAKVEAEPHRAYELLDSEVLPSRWEEAEAALIAKGLILDRRTNIGPT